MGLYKTRKKYNSTIKTTKEKRLRVSNFVVVVVFAGKPWTSSAIQPAKRQREREGNEFKALKRKIESNTQKPERKKRAFWYKNYNCIFTERLSPLEVECALAHMYFAAPPPLYHFPPHFFI